MGFWLQPNRLPRLFGLGIVLGAGTGLVLKQCYSTDYWIAITVANWYFRIGIALPDRIQLPSSRFASMK